VAEVIIGLLQGDKQSYLAQDPDWTPTLPTVEVGQQGTDFTMIDLLTVADPEAGNASVN
jgi:hypothetical protein